MGRQHPINGGEQALALLVSLWLCQYPGHGIPGASRLIRSPHQNVAPVRYPECFCRMRSVPARLLISGEGYSWMRKPLFYQAIKSQHQRYPDANAQQHTKGGEATEGDTACQCKAQSSADHYSQAD